MTFPGEWRTVVLRHLAEHLANSLNAILPEDLEFLADGLELVLVRRQSGRPLKSLGSEAITSVEGTEVDTSIDVIATHILTDVQDLVVMHLQEGWPRDSQNAAVHGWAARSGDFILLGFRGRDANTDTPGIDLPPFRLPAPPATTHQAG